MNELITLFKHYKINLKIIISIKTDLLLHNKCNEGHQTHIGYNNNNSNNMNTLQSQNVCDHNL